MRNSYLALMLSPIAAVVCAMTWAVPADAGFRGQRTNYEPGERVTARSHFGNGTVSGVVRPARFGWEVRLPHGTWVACRRSCEDTLRVQTVDLLETDGTLTGYGTLQQECGIFGCLRLNF